MKLKKHYLFIFFFVLCVIGFILRYYSLDQNLFFGPEQGRDLLVVKSIVEDYRLTLIGARTEIEGIFYGPFYYYLMSIPFIIGDGNPLFFSLFLIFFNLTGIVSIYLLGKSLFNKNVGLVSAVLYTFSFGIIVSSRWLSHPPLAIPLSILFFLFLVKYLNGKSRWLIWVVIIFGLLGQTQFLSYLFFFLILIGMIVIFRKRFKKEKPIFLLSGAALLFLSAYGTIIVFDLRHDFLITKNILLLLSRKTGFYTSFFSAVTNTSQNLVASFSHTVIPFQFYLSLTIFIVSIFLLGKKYKENRNGVFFVLAWIFIPVITFILLRHGILEHYFMSVLPAFILLTAITVSMVWKKKIWAGVLLLLVIIGLNVFTWVSNIPVSGYLFFQAAQPQITYNDQVKVIDTIYSEAKGEKFSFQAYTIPYWLQGGWEYLFWYHGKKYGHQPVAEKAKTLFVIVQDDPGNMLFQNMWLKDTVVHWGTEIKSFRIGIFIIKVLSVEKS